MTFMRYENKKEAETKLDMRVAENSSEIRYEELVNLRVAENNNERVIFMKKIENNKLEDSIGDECGSCDYSPPASSVDS